jgi:hypothetical protein
MSNLHQPVYLKNKYPGQFGLSFMEPAEKLSAWIPHLNYRNRLRSFWGQTRPPHYTSILPAKAVTGYSYFLCYYPKNIWNANLLSFLCIYFCVSFDIIWDLHDAQEMNTWVAGFEVLTAVVTKSSIFWNITPCSPRRRLVPPKRPLALNELHGVVLQKISLFNTRVDFVYLSEPLDGFWWSSIQIFFRVSYHGPTRRPLFFPRKIPGTHFC